MQHPNHTIKPKKVTDKIADIKFTNEVSGVKFFNGRITILVKNGNIPITTRKMATGAMMSFKLKSKGTTF